MIGTLLLATACLTVGSARDTAYLVTDGEDRTSCGELDATNLETEAAVRFRLDGETWVARDPAVVAEAHRLFEKVNWIGGRQGAVGAKQGRIGAEQGMLGMEQAKAAMRRLDGPDAGKQDERAAAERADRMRELSRRMEPLAREQSALAAEMKRELAAAQAGLAELLERAMKDGTAVRVRRV